MEMSFYRLCSRSLSKLQESHCQYFEMDKTLFYCGISFVSSSDQLQPNAKKPTTKIAINYQTGPDK